MSRKIIFFIVTITILLAAIPAQAGGWVVITLESLPDGIQVGEPVSIGFVVRQHGQTPTHDLSPVLMATNTESGQEIRIEAIKAREIGRFTAVIDFPSEGEWEWSISAEPFNQTLMLAPVFVDGPLQILEADAHLTGGYQPQVVLRWVALILLGDAFLLRLLDRRPKSDKNPQVAGD